MSASQNKSELIHVLRCALEWALTHGVKAESWSQTGYWQQGGSDGMEIMPPAKLHEELDRARRGVLAHESAAEIKEKPFVRHCHRCDKEVRASYPLTATVVYCSLECAD